MIIQRIALVLLISATTVLGHMTFALSAQAEETRSLSAVMTDIGRTFGRIARPVQQGTAGATEAVLSRDLHLLVLEAGTILPDSILDLPESEQGPRIELYSTLISALAKTVTDLEAAILIADHAAAQAALQVALRLRSQGHEEFKL